MILGIVLIFTISIAFACSQQQVDAEGFTSLFNGTNLDGWKIPEGDNGHWKVTGGVIDYDGKSEAPEGVDKNLWSNESYKNFILKIDWRLPGTPHEIEHPSILPDGTYDKNPDGSTKMDKIMESGDSGVYLRGNSKSQVNMWCWPIGSGEVYGYRTDKSMPPEVIKGVTPTKNTDNPMGEWNSMVITMKGEYLTVAQNGETVIENAQLPGVPETGPLALQHHNDPVQFRNISIKELP